jgi:hypothetical protein
MDVKTAPQEENAMVKGLFGWTVVRLTTDPTPSSSQRLSGLLRHQQTSPVCTGHTNDPIGMWLG